MTYFGSVIARSPFGRVRSRAKQSLAHPAFFALFELGVLEADSAISLTSRRSLPLKGTVPSCWRSRWQFFLNRSLLIWQLIVLLQYLYGDFFNDQRGYFLMDAAQG